MIPWVNDINKGSVERQSIVRETNGTYTNMLYANTYGRNAEAISNFNRRSDAFQKYDIIGINGISPAMNYPEYSTSTQKIGIRYLNGLSVEVIEKYSWGDMKVKIRFNDYNMEGFKRWTGYISLPDLTANSNYDLILTGSGSFLHIDKSKIPNRNTLLNGEFINPSEFTLMPNSSFLLGVNTELRIDNQSTVVLESNSKIFMERYSDINVINNSTLIIKEGAKIEQLLGSRIYIDATSTIIFDGGGFENYNYRYLTVDGTLKVGQNKTLTLTEPGNIILNGSIEADAGASIIFNGTNKTTILLEVQRSISFDTDFAGVTIRNGKIVMNNSTSELLINQGVDNVIIDNVWVTSSTGANNGHQGIDIRSDGNVSITNSKFEMANCGIISSRAATAPNLTIATCTFANCNTGLLAYNSGVSINGCTFENNTYTGVECISMDLDSYINNSTIRYHSNTSGKAVYYVSSGLASLSMQGTTISNNYNGAYFLGAFNVSANCCNISNNTKYGLLADGAYIYLAYAPGISGGSNQIYSNLYALQLKNSSRFTLNNGYNDLRSDSYCLYGTMTGFTPTTWSANNNYWKTGGGAPVINVNYQLTGANGAVTITDNSPEGAYYLCEAPGDLIEGTATATTPDEPAAYRTVTTDLGTLPLDETVETTLNTDAETGTVYDEATQFGLMAQTLNNDLAALNPAEEEQAAHTYRMLRSSLGAQIGKNGKADPAQLDNMLQVIRKLQDDDKQREGKQVGKKLTARYFALALDEAQTLWLKQDYTGAIALLQSLIAKATADQLCEIQKLICQIEIDREFIASNNTLDIEELLAQCSGSEKSGSTNNSSGNGQNAAETGNLLLAGVSLSVVPHPVTGTSEIQIKGLAQPATLTVYNSLGAVVIQREVIGESTTMKITRNELKPGMYLITLNQNGTTLQTLKMVVQ